MGDRGVSTLPFESDGLRAIVFDLDGTLYRDDRLGNGVNLSACRYLAELKGVPVEEAELMLQQARDCLSGTGKTLSRSVVALGGNLPDMHAHLSRDLHPEALLSIDPRVPDLLRLLSERFDLHIYTNNNRELSGRIMTQIGVAGLFQRVFTIEEYWRPKPDDTALAGILAAIGCQPKETLFVGDRYEVDLALPAALGCRVLETTTIEALLTLAELDKTTVRERHE